MLNTSRRLYAPRRCQSLLVSHSRLKMLLCSPIRLIRSTTALLCNASVCCNMDPVQIWIWFDISITESQLACYCASDGRAQWAAPHHLMEYLSNHPSFKILSGHADADYNISGFFSEKRQNFPRNSNTPFRRSTIDYNTRVTEALLRPARPCACAHLNSALFSPADPVGPYL